MDVFEISDGKYMQIGYIVFLMLGCNLKDVGWVSKYLFFCTK